MTQRLIIFLKKATLPTGLLVILGAFILNGCDDKTINTSHTKQADLIIYSGITMVRPLLELAEAFEKQHSIKVEIKQGASGYLYNTLKVEQEGDIYFPGSDSYRLNNQADGLLTDFVFVGYNRLALEVAKGNPKGITSDLTQLTNPELAVVLSSPDSSAVGKNTEFVLNRLGITEAVYQNVAYFTSDSHRIYSAIRSGDADVSLNWYATMQWPEQKPYVDAIMLPETLAIPKRLELNLLSFSKNKPLAKAFIAFASSAHGLQVFANYGFLTPDELQQALSSQLSEPGLWKTNATFTNSPPPKTSRF